MKVWLSRFLVTAFLGMAIPLLAAESSSPSTAMPWNVQALSTAPTFHWVDRKETRVKTLLYTGLPFNGKPTEVFAYYASPLTLGRVAKAPPGGFPGIVLVHGGGGSAFMKWAALWAEHGYAAIAMDLAGVQAPDSTLEEENESKEYQSRRQRLPNGGPDQSSVYKFSKINEPFEQQWSYHAVANVMLAHSLLRQFPEVNPEKTAITGISWGGYVTCLTASVDSRFKAAVPVYGCGFYQEGTTWSLPKGPFAALSEDGRAKWTKLWDPASYLPRLQAPIFFVNGTNDHFFWLESYRKTYDAVSAPKNIRLEVKMVHGHPPGWAPKEIAIFIDNVLLGTPGLPLIGGVKESPKGIRATVSGPVAVTAARLIYTVDAKLNEDRVFQSLDATVRDGQIIAPALPAGTLVWLLEATDERGARVTTAPFFTASNTH